MLNADLEKLATDLRIISDARSVVIFVATRGKGKHEIPFDTFSEILDHGGRVRVRRALASAVKHGWLQRTPGGWGRSDFYEFVPPDRGSPGDLTVEAPRGSPSDPTGDDPMGSPSAPTGPSEYLQAPEENPVRSFNDPTGAPRGSRGDPSVVEEEEGVRRGSPPVVPPAHALDKRVSQALDDPIWAGCRSAMQDYFRERVETSRQHGYLRTVQTWVEHGTGPRGFGPLAPGDRKKLIATSLNELLSESERTERMYASSRGHLGQIRTLQTKLEVAVKRSAPHQQAELPLGAPAKQQDDDIPEGFARDPAGRLYKRMDD